MIEVAAFSSALSQQPASTTSTSPLDPKSLPQKAVIAPIAKTVPQARPNRVLKSIPTATKQRETTSSKAEAHPESPGSNSAAFSNSKSAEATGSADTTIPPDFHSASLHNPPTAYPLMAAKRGIEGIVKLKVQVLPNGEPGLIELATSSGADVLDTSAIEQVRKWRFIPARRKNVAVTGWVIVPLVFELTR
jgi:protein TonB